MAVPLKTEAIASGGDAKVSTLKECLIFDNDSAEDLSPIFGAIRQLGFLPVHAQGLAELAERLADYIESSTRPAALLIDVHIPNYPDLGLLDRPDVEIGDSNIAGVIIYEKVLMSLPGIGAAPVIFISSHNNIAVLDAHRLRVKFGKSCMFVSKGDFVEQIEFAFEELRLKDRTSPREGFGAEHFERLWVGVCEYYELGDQEKFAVLGLRPESKMDFLNLIASSDDARERINILVDIGTCLRILYDDITAQKSAMNAAKKGIVSSGTVRQVVGRGNLLELERLRSRLEQICGAR